MKHKIPKNQDGQIIIIILVFMLVIMVLISGMVGYAGLQARSHRQAVAREQAISIAEAGIEKAIWKLNNQTGYTGETGTVFGAGIYSVTITDLSSTSKLIKAEAYVPNQANFRGRRTIQATVTTGTTNISFNYGVQIGQGGLEMSNSAMVLGNVYSGGDIIGSNSARIQGSAIVSGPTGKIDGMIIDEGASSHFIEDSTVHTAYHYDLTRTTVTASASVHSMSNCTIGDNASYNVRVSCAVANGQTTPNPNVPADPPAVPLPVSESQIDTWEQEAQSGGEISGQSYSSGTINLGPKKINGDLILSGTAEVVVNGTLWITGQLKLSNSARIRLSSNFGANSGVVVVGVDESSTNGYIEISNSAQALGSGAAGSYLMLLSQKEGTGSTAIKNSNSGTSAILYAGEGLIELSNSAQMKEVTAYKLKISNNATVTYESGLSSAQFSSGPGGGWELMDSSWQLLQ